MADETADVIVVGAGLAGLVAAAELTDAGRRWVILLDQEGEQCLGGQAFWSFGGFLFVDLAGAAPPGHPRHARPCNAGLDGFGRL